MRVSLSLSGGHAACREQLNTFVHSISDPHSNEAGVKRAVAHYVAAEILDKAQAAGSAATPGSVSIAIDVTAS